MTPLPPAEVEGETVDAIYEAVMDDLSNRRGIRQAFDDIDEDVMFELASTLKRKIADVLAASRARLGEEGE